MRAMISNLSLNPGRYNHSKSHPLVVNELFPNVFKDNFSCQTVLSLSQDLSEVVM